MGFFYDTKCPYWDQVTSASNHSHIHTVITKLLFTAFTPLLVQVLAHAHTNELLTYKCIIGY